jgi:hypothetical protein
MLTCSVHYFAPKFRLKALGGESNPAPTDISGLSSPVRHATVQHKCPRSHGTDWKKHRRCKTGRDSLRVDHN